MDQPLIIKFLSGEASTDEVRRLTDWIKQNDENKSEFIKLKNLWTVSGLNLSGELSYSGHDLNILKTKIHCPESSSVKKLYIWLWRVAAILFIPLSILGTLYFSNKQVKEDSISYSEIITPNREKATVILPDGSKIMLNSNSYLRYNDNFSHQSRTVFFEGEAFFEIDKDHARPFIVKTDELDIQVLGTVFNVSAYPDDQTIETTLISGKVHVTPKISGGPAQKVVELNPSQQMIYEKQSHEINTKTVNTDLYTSWTRGEFIFQKEKLSVIMKKIERWYDIQVVINDPKIADQRLSGRFRDEEPLGQVLEVIKLTTPIQYTIKEKVVIIDKE
jgi:ferric-dicitrate binding protein FerR (iron transport regulator)